MSPLHFTAALFYIYSPILCIYTVLILRLSAIHPVYLFSGYLIPSPQVLRFVIYSTQIL